MTLPPTNLEPIHDRFVGRERELAELSAALTKGDARLVTLTGTAGVGKTRLSRELALRIADAFADAGGVWFCDLREARSLEALCRVVAGALAVPLGGAGDDAVAQIGRALAGRGRLVLVLDNLEQLAGVVAPMLSTWLDQAPDLRVVTTSRELLRAPAELVRRVDPLPVGDGASDEPSESVVLFFDRAATARGSALDRDVHGRATRDLVQRLDGLPLAIELAAARTLSLTPADLLARLSTRLDLLVGGPRAFGMRTTALRASLEASWEMLDAVERSALAQSAVFSSGFTLEAAEAVIDLAEGRSPAPAQPVALVLEVLSAKSLLVSRSATELPGEARFSLYESIRAFAAEHLDEASRRRAEARHAAYWLGAFASPSAAFGTAKDPTEAFAHLALARNELLSIVDRALETTPMSKEAAHRALRAALALERLDRRDAPLAYAALLDRVLGQVEPVADEAMVGRALLCRGLANGARRWDAMIRDLEAARRLGESIGDAELEGQACARLSVARLDRGARDDAVRLFERARDLAGGRDGGALGALVSAVGAVLLLDEGAIDAGLAALETACRTFAEEGDPQAALLFAFRRGFALADRQRLDEAAEAFDATRTLAKTLGYIELEAGMGYHLAGIDHERGLLSRAESGMRGACHAARRAGLVRLEGLASTYLGQLLMERGRTRDARESFTRARDALGAADQGLVLAQLGALDAHDDRLEAAEACFTRAEGVLAEGEALRAVVEVCRGHADLSRARKSASEGDHAAAEAFRARAEARLEGAALTHRSQNVRLAARVLRAALGAKDRGDVRAFVVGPDARWFRPTQGRAVTFRKQIALRRLLLELTAKRLDAPGVALDLDALVAVGWPGEHLRAEAAANRLYVAIATLRRLGLRDVLVRRDDGWLLEPGVPVVRSEDLAAGATPDAPKRPRRRAPAKK